MASRLDHELYEKTLPIFDQMGETGWIWIFRSEPGVMLDRTVQPTGSDGPAYPGGPINHMYYIWIEKQASLMIGPSGPSAPRYELETRKLPRLLAVLRNPA